MNTEARAEMPATLRSERGPPPYFAGRREELAALHRRLDDLCDTGDPADGMALVVGVPGVGKTQLGRKFTDEAARRNDLPAGRPIGSMAPVDVRWLTTDTSLLEDDVDVFLAMAQALDAQSDARKVAELDTRSTGRTAGVGVVRGGHTLEHARHTGGLSAMLGASRQAGMWRGKALVLVVDELQTVRPQGMNALRVLHQGAHECPILLLGIGLQHTQQVLARPADGSAGISRVAAPIELQCLSEKDTLVAIRENLLALGHEVPEACVQVLAQASHGFGQHIHGYLTAAVDAIANQGTLQVGASLDDALRAGDQARANYYDSRLGVLPKHNAILPVVRAMRAQRRDSLWEEEAATVIADASFDGEETVQEAIKHGVLTLRSGAVSFGIPSFRDHMERLLDRYDGYAEKPSTAALG